MIDLEQVRGSIPRASTLLFCPIVSLAQLDALRNGMHGNSCVSLCDGLMESAQLLQKKAMLTYNAY
jgi:hypothetical protein